MNTLTSRSLLPLLVFAVGAFAAMSVANSRLQAVTVSTFVRLGGTADGYDPQAALIKGTDGNFYGTTEAGGLPNCGTVFKITGTGTLTTVYSFKGTTDGANPKGGLVLGGDGNYYGTTSAAGAGNTGTVFKITPAGALTTLHGFTARDTSTKNADGAYPAAGLLKGSDGNFYGTAYQGGAYAEGTVFKITPTGTFTTVYSFGVNNNGSDGALPSAALAQGSDGNFYGTTRNGGTDFSGSVFRLTPAGVLTTLYTFTGGTDGGTPLSALVKATDGNFYGMTEFGGSASAGTAFKITQAGVFTSLHSFSATVDGQQPLGSLIQGTDGNLYGTTSNRGPNNGYGTVFKMTTAGAVTVLYTFPLVTSNGNEGALDGAGAAAGVLQGSDGNFYGTTAGGGTLNNSTLGLGGGTVFKLTPSGTLSSLHAFEQGGADSSAALLQASDGNFYGTTVRGGAMNGGTVFSYDPSGNIQGLHDFDPDTEGNGPAAALVQDSSGNIFGTATQGGSEGGGTLFQLSTSSADASLAIRRHSTRSAIDPVPSVFPPSGIRSIDILATLLSELGYSPEEISGIIFGLSGNAGSLASSSPQANAAETIYLIATRGGDDSAGSIYGYAIDTGKLSALYEFGTQTNDGLTPQGMTLGKDGNFYGVTLGGGAYQYGTIFKYTPGATTTTTLHSFTGQGNGAQPRVGLLLASDGNFYGVTPFSTASATAGVSGSGTIFQITPAGAYKTLHYFASNQSEGAQPVAKLLQGKDGLIYGTTVNGGTVGVGTIFSITTSGTFTSLHSFGNYGEGNQPTSAMIQGTDGNLYGTTSAGGTDGSGTIYQVSLKEAAPVITSAKAATASLGKTFSYQITASNSPTSYGESGIPSGLSTNQTTGKISGTPTKAGTYSVTIAAFNSGGSGSAKLTLTVVAAPVITSAATATATVGTAFSYQIAATNSPTSYGESGIPSGLSINQTTGEISGTPTKAGTYTVTIAAFNSAGSGSAKLTLTVKAAAAKPVITSSLNPPSRQGVAFSYQITATNSPTNYGESGIPTGLTINQSTGKITGTPTKAGTYTVTIAAFNSAGSGSAKLTLVVKPPA